MPCSSGRPATHRRGFPAGPSPRAGALLATAVVVLTALLTGTPAAAAVPACRVGAYVTDLYALDPARQTVDADLWLWSVCPRKDLDAVRRVEFTNATRTTLTERTTEKVGSEYWAQIKVAGTFRQDFDLTDFPFDRQTIRIRIEEAELDDSRFVYRADLKNSDYNHRIRLADFKITKFRIGVVDSTYRTNFGDPRLENGGGSRYSQLVLQFQVTRQDITSFVKQVLPVYVAFLIALISFLIWSKDDVVILVARLGILGAALFTIVINMRASDQALGTVLGVPLVDQVHLISLLYVLTGVATTTYILRLWTDPLVRPAVRRVNYRILVAATALYLIANIGAVAIAVSL
ncbi:hypothetical protein [Streptomyces sp. NPDC048639]|uniref:hypothetical protein n=1 Tax=Streptomyces sp. NPDC048639 TaxID=3365581 RepID=UPI003724506D